MTNRFRRCALLTGSVLTSTALLAGFAAVPGNAATTVPEVAPYFETTGAHAGNLHAAIASHGLRSFTAAFVLAKGCTPTWDNYAPISTATALNKLVSDAKTQGASPIISFGGQSGNELAKVCTDQTKLVAAYTSVINKFKVTKIDFDIEGKAALNNTAANTRRFKAIKTLEAKFPSLQVSVTIPVGPNGIETNDPEVGDGVKFLKLAKTLATRLDVVNLMTMDYGVPVTNMGTTATTAATRSMAQVKAIWPAKTYANLGITPMIGQNDSAGEMFSYTDSQTVLNFAKSHGVRRVAFWALNRDQACGGGDTAPDTCTNASQGSLDYTDGFLN
jgi:Glycosyl hydrolases family 18